MTRYLDAERLAAVDEEGFRRVYPQPWCNPAALLRPQSYTALLEALPPPELFEEVVGRKRAHGQDPHDRLALEYRRDLPIAAVWHEFVAELEGPEYRAFIRRMLGSRRFRLNYHWHYTPTGCSVSPHCDANHKLGSHIFYFNTPQDWRPEWGGQTMVLDAKGRFSRDSAPDFEELDVVHSAESMGNQSFLFTGGNKLWHGMRELRCPEGVYRKIFVVVINDALLSLYPRYVKPALRALKSPAAR